MKFNKTGAILLGLLSVGPMTLAEEGPVMLIDVFERISKQEGIKDVIHPKLMKFEKEVQIEKLKERKGANGSMQAILDGKKIFIVEMTEHNIAEKSIREEGNGIAGWKILKESNAPFMLLGHLDSFVSEDLNPPIEICEGRPSFKITFKPKEGADKLKVKVKLAIIYRLRGAIYVDRETLEVCRLIADTGTASFTGQVTGWPDPKIDKFEIDFQQQYMDGVWVKKSIVVTTKYHHFPFKHPYERVTYSYKKYKIVR